MQNISNNLCRNLKSENGRITAKIIAGIDNTVKYKFSNFLKYPSRGTSTECLDTSKSLIDISNCETGRKGNDLAALHPILKC
jgi:hypothetical protein